MPRATPIWSSFNSGELSPFLESRVDLQKFYSGLALCDNFVPVIGGPLTRRPGTMFVGEIKDGEARAIEFRFSAEQNYILEFGNLYIRFWRNRAQLFSLGVPYEIASPFTTADLENIRYVQSLDTVYLACGRLPVQKLRRLGDVNWTIGNVPFRGGPLGTQNTNKGVKAWAIDAAVDPGAEGHTVTIHADGNIFTPGMIGTFFELEWETRPDLPTWQVGNSYAGGDLVYYQGNVYRAENAVGTTGTTPPTHTEGTAQDGGGGTWFYMHSGYGLVFITAYTSPTEVTAVVSTRLPLETIDTFHTYRWTRGSYGGDIGWPTNVSLFRERLVLGNKIQLDLSVANDFENFARREAGQFLADDAISVQIASGTIDDLEWFTPDTNGLIMGTRSQELVLDEASSNQPFGSDNFRIRPHSQYGSKHNARVATVGTNIVYAMRTGTRLLSAAYDFGQQKLVSENISSYAEHILEPGIMDVVYQQQPYSIIWLVLTDGSLIGWTYDQLNGVIAAHRHTMVNADIESAACIPSPDGSKDDLWLFLRRTINGVTRRYVEILTFSDPYLTQLESSRYLDSYQELISPVDVTIVSGLDHLIGQTVGVLGDGAVLLDQVVSPTGQITLSHPSKHVFAGINMTSRMQTMPLEAGAADGTALGRWKRVSEVIVRFINSLGGKAGPNITETDIIPTRMGGEPMDQPPSLRVNTYIALQLPGHFNRSGAIAIVQDQPLPMTIVSITAKVVTND